MKTTEGEDAEETIPIQISPVFMDKGEISNTEFELIFQGNISALGLQTYFIEQMKPDEGTNKEMTVADIQMYNSKRDPFQVDHGYVYHQ